MDLSPAALEDLLSSCSSIQKLYFDREVQALLDVATPSSRAEAVVRQGTTLTGKDVTIAIIDTGIYPHPDLENRIVAFRDFVNKIVIMHMMIMDMEHIVQGMQPEMVGPLMDCIKVPLLTPMLLGLKYLISLGQVLYLQ